MTHSLSAYFSVLSSFALTAQPLENYVGCVTICLFAASLCMEGDAGPASALYIIHKPILKDTKTNPRPACTLMIILIPLLKSRAWDLSGPRG